MLAGGLLFLCPKIKVVSRAFCVNLKKYYITYCNFVHLKSTTASIISFWRRTKWLHTVKWNLLLIKSFAILYLCSGNQVGICSTSEICSRGHFPREWLPNTTRHCLLHPKPSTQENTGENTAHTVCWQEPGVWREVGYTCISAICKTTSRG